MKAKIVPEFETKENRELRYSGAQPDIWMMIPPRGQCDGFADRKLEGRARLVRRIEVTKIRRRDHIVAEMNPIYHGEKTKIGWRENWMRRCARQAIARVTPVVRQCQSRTPDTISSGIRRECRSVSSQERQ